MNIFKIALILTLTACCSFAEQNQKQIELPLRFYIVDNITMSKKGVEMKSWITEKDIRGVVMPELNAIWDPAKIRFTVKSVNRVQTENSLRRKKKELIDYIVNSHRDENGQSDPKRIKKYDEMIDFDEYDRKEFSILLVPYMGEASQGVAKRGKGMSLIGLYTDKASDGKKPPKKFVLMEPRPFKEGSLSRTLAHEIGHLLGLDHPDKQTQKVFHRLMGGKRKAYKLTDEEIIKARVVAKQNQ